MLYSLWGGRREAQKAAAEIISIDDERRLFEIILKSLKILQVIILQTLAGSNGKEKALKLVKY